MAAHGEKMPWFLRVLFQLLPQPAHVNVNGAGQHSGFIAPNLAQQFIARKRSAALSDKVGQQLKLSRREFDLLRHLIDHRNRVQSRDRLLERVWGYDAAAETRAVDVHIGRLRAKLGAAGRQIETVVGLGYRFIE